MNDPEWHGFLIGCQPTPRLHVTYLSPSGYPEEGWHSFRAEAVAPGFSAQFNFASLLDEFKLFKSQVVAMHEALQGMAHFESTESNVIVKATMDRFGHVFWEVTLSGAWQGESQPTLTFSIEDDQTSLAKIVKQIEGMLKAQSPA